MLFLRHFWYHFIWYKSKPIQKDKTQRVYETLDNDWNLASLPMTHSSRVCSAVVFCTGLNSSYPSPPIPAHFTSIPTHSPHRPSPSQSPPPSCPCKVCPHPTHSHKVCPHPHFISTKVNLAQSFNIWHPWLYCTTLPETITVISLQSTFTAKSQ